MRQYVLAALAGLALTAPPAVAAVSVDRAESPARVSYPASLWSSEDARPAARVRVMEDGSVALKVRHAAGGGYRCNIGAPDGEPQRFAGRCRR